MSKRQSMVQSLVTIGTVAIFALMGGLGCLQASGLAIPFVGASCSFQMADSSVLVKALGWSLFILFLVVLGIPVLLVIVDQYSRNKQLPQANLQ